ncbi:MAG: thioesterase family protein [Bacteroidetes bacterium]|nr:thioesterase family protein [Bacteroidota bacterium]
MFQSTTQVRVRYSETDQMGVVYHGNYAAFFEIGRTDALRDLGLTYKQFEEEGIMMPVFDLSFNFHKPAYYDDLLVIKTSISKLPAVRARFDYEIYNGKDELITTGHVTLVSVNMNSKRPCKSPATLVEKLTPYFI